MFVFGVLAMFPFTVHAEDYGSCYVSISTSSTVYDAGYFDWHSFPSGCPSGSRAYSGTRTGDATKGIVFCSTGSISVSGSAYSQSYSGGCTCYQTQCSGNRTISISGGGGHVYYSSSSQARSSSSAKSPNSYASISITSPLYSDETLPPPVINNLSTGTITYKYSTSQNGTYSTTKPALSGTYWVKAEIAGDNNCNPYTTAAKSFRLVGWTGSGTETAPYVISSNEELDLLARRVNSGNNNYKDTYFELGADITYDPENLTIDLDGDGPNLSNFTPIGNEKTGFLGNFDGKGHTISGIVVRSSSNYVGLFSRVVTTASIKNLIFVNSTIEGNEYVGGIAGAIALGSISGCISRVNVSGTLFVGGIAGHNMGGISGSISGANVFGTQYVGGIAGHNMGGIRGSISDAEVSGAKHVGGIVGVNSSSLENSLYLGSSVTATEKIYVGAIVGYPNSSSLIGNYYTLEGLGGAGDSKPATDKDIDGARKAVVLSAASGVNMTVHGDAVVYDVSDITAYEKNRGVLYKGVFYAGATENVVLNLGYSVSDGDVLTGYTDGNGNALVANDDGSYTLTMTSAAATVTPAIKYLWGEGANGSAEHPYIITSTEGLDLLAQKVNGGNKYENTYFELGADIEYGSKPLTIDLDGNGPNLSNYIPIGKENAAFWGKFDGKGHKVSGIVVRSNSDYVGLFGYVIGNIKNLTIANSSFEGNNKVGGIVGQVGYKAAIVENCQVSSDVSVMGKSYVGGIVGNNGGQIKGSSSAADVSGKQVVGGIVGENKSNCVIENSLYYGTSVTATDNRYVGAIAGFVGANGSFSNSYHTLNGMGGVGNSESATGEDTDDARKAVAFSAADGVTLTPVGNPVNYDVSGITAYEKDGKISSGILYGGVLYAGETEDVMLKLGINSNYEVPEEHGVVGYTDGNGKALVANSDGTYTLTMTSDAATVTPTIKHLWGEGAEGTAENPYIITSTEGLDLLAQKVNEGNRYKNTYFELGDNITYDPIDSDKDGELETNYTPIGDENNVFEGKFDGKGYTISGIVVKNSSDDVSLFGHVMNASIRNLNLSNSSFVGNEYVGGIVGIIGNGNVIIENCHVSDVSVKGTHYVGGFVGFNYGKIEGSTSNAKVSGNGFVGGVVGGNGGLVKNSLYLGTSITATEDSRVGAIAGFVFDEGCFTNNYHTLDGMGGVGNSESATGEDTDDAMLAKVANEMPTSIGTAGTPYGTGDYVGITPYTRGLEYKGRFYCKPLWKGNGTENDPYIITSTEGLDKLASDVNSGNRYNNTYFELGADIEYGSKPLTIDLDGDGPNLSNFTPIGYSNAIFAGNFDGKGHKISGIVVRSNSDHVGLFGLVYYAIVKNLTLAGSTFEGNRYLGGIVGRVGYKAAIVENCHVSKGVRVKGSSYYVGSIVGLNEGNIRGSTSGAEVSGKGIIGGIVGSNMGILENSLYFGPSVKATENRYVGAISGGGSGTIKNNYHTLKDMGGVGDNVSATGNVIDNAKFAAPFSVVPAGIGTAETSYGTGDYVGITPYTNGLEYKGRYYYAGTRVGEGYAAVQIFEDAEGKKHAIIDGEYDGPDAVNIEEDIDVTSVTFSREFTPNSGFATIMFPFNVNASSLAGVRSIIEFAGVFDNNGKNAVGMKYVWCNADLGAQEYSNGRSNCNKLSGNLTAYTPYMVEMDSPMLGIEGKITLTSNSGKTVGDARKGNWVFRGTLQKDGWSNEDVDIKNDQIWTFAASASNGTSIGKFVQLEGQNSVKPFQAFLYNLNGKQLAGTGELGSMDIVILADYIDYTAVQIFKVANGNKHAVIDGSYGASADEPEAVSIPADIEVNSVEITREFPTGSDNAFSTTVLPFDVNTANVSGLRAVLYYNGIKNGSTISMKVLWAEKGYIKNKDGSDKEYEYAQMAANTPYLVLMKNSEFKLKSEAYPIKIKQTTPANTEIEGCNWVFHGTWKYKKWGSSCSTGKQDCDKETGFAYGFAASASEDNKIDVGTFVKVGEGAWIRPMRAYLVHKDKLQTPQFARANGAYVKRPTVEPEELPELMSVVIDGDGDENETTVIGQFNTRTGEFKMNYDRGKFDLKGRRVNGTNNARGAYYGKKVLKK